MQYYYVSWIIHSTPDRVMHFCQRKLQTCRCGAALIHYYSFIIQKRNKGTDHCSRFDPQAALVQSRAQYDRVQPGPNQHPTIFNKIGLILICGPLQNVLKIKIGIGLSTLVFFFRKKLFCIKK